MSNPVVHALAPSACLLLRHYVLEGSRICVERCVQPGDVVWRHALQRQRLRVQLQATQVGVVATQCALAPVHVQRGSAEVATGAGGRLLARNQCKVAVHKAQVQPRRRISLRQRACLVAQEEHWERRRQRKRHAPSIRSTRTAAVPSRPGDAFG
eukprot:365679-Chlamydomonas_euryale.AAC.14